MTGVPDQPIQWSRRWTLAAAVLVLSAAVFAALIATGVFDPQPIGSPMTETHLDEVVVSPGSEQLTWVGDSSPISRRQAHTWQLRAAYAGGELDSGYGLAVGDADRALIIALSPLGYAAIWEQDRQGRQSTVWLPWQTWPHVAIGQDENEIWLDVIPEEGFDRVNIRINRELLWTGDVAPLAASSGIWAGSFGEGMRIDFRQLRRFEARAMGTGEE